MEILGYSTMEYYGILWNTMEYYGILWNTMEIVGQNLVQLSNLKISKFSKSAITRALFNE